MQLAKYTFFHIIYPHFFSQKAKEPIIGYIADFTAVKSLSIIIGYIADFTAVKSLSLSF